MTHFMAYVALVSAGIAACATVVELIVRSRTSRARWVWVSALGAVIIATLLVAFLPASRVEEAVVAASRPLSIDGVTASPIAVEVTLPQRNRGMLQIADDLLLALWLASSLALLSAILVGRKRLSLECGSAKRTEVNGREVLLTEDVGPAVAGVGSPVVLLPRWVLALDTPSQQVLLDHEFEHVEQGDTRLLLAGAVATALMPWNPVMWWVTRRLRLAVEQDCDARVLRMHPDVRRYADLLLTAASQPRVSARLLAAHFGEHRSDLDRRIQAMTERKTKWDRLLVAGAVAAALVAVSCEAPRPAPLAPSEQETARSQLVSANDVLYEFQVEKNAKLVSGSAMPRYPEILRQAGVEGVVLASFVVDATGTADTASLKIIRSSHELFSVAVRRALTIMRFEAAEVGGKKVKQRVQQPFTFELPELRKRLAAGVRDEVPVESWERKAVPRLYLRQENAPSEPVNFEIRTSRGDVVSRYSSEKMPREVRVDDIEAIEVYRPKSCPVGALCPLIQIRLKPGRESAYRP